MTEERAQGDGTWGLTVKGRDFREILRRASGGSKGGIKLFLGGPMRMYAGTPESFNRANHFFISIVIWFRADFGIAVFPLTQSS